MERRGELTLMKSGVVQRESLMGRSDRQRSLGAKTGGNQGSDVCMKRD